MITSSFCRTCVAVSRRSAFNCSSPLISACESNETSELLNRIVSKLGKHLVIRIGGTYTGNMNSADLIFLKRADGVDSKNGNWP